MTVVDRIKSTSAALWARGLAMLAVLAVGGTAMAQSVVVFVNGDPITAIDIEHRTKFLALTGQKATSRQQVLDELIDEILKVREGRRWGIEISNADVDASYTRMARGMNQSSEQLTQSLAQKGIGASTLKSKIRADMVWSQLVRGRYQSRLQVSDKQVVSALEEKDAADAVGYEYVLRPILFLVPPGAGGAVYDGRRKEADALRKTFKGCNESIPGVRAMRDVAVRDQVVRSSTGLPDNLRKVLDGVPVGELTPPEVTRHGIEMFAICSRNETKTDTPSREKARQTLQAKAFEAESKKYLRQLRKNAMIERGK
ncbi:MAG: SurA N-terminal domain-containing protein [Xanthobacteraceae bacterium]|nr:SurA N-terminal domain-containing protein [Xanthobacteraceae bacterium]